MVDVTQPAGTTRPAPAGAQTKPPSGLGAAIQALEIDTRLIGMLIALAVIWIGFHIFSGGVFLTPRNLWNLSVQTSSVAVMATGMVLVIVSRNIDLSVGSVLGFIGMVMAAVQVEILPHYVGFDWPFTWIITLAIGIGVGALIGAVQGGVIAYLGVPAFIVTLGGLLVWRGAAWWVAQGRTIAPLDTNFQRIGGGGLHGSIGGTASWVVAAIACIGIVLLVMNERRQRRRFHFPLRPVWAEFTIAIVGCILVLGAVSVINAYPLPIGLARQFAEANGIPWPEGGLFISLGIAIPVLIALGAGIVMTFVATRTRFGRYVFAIGGNPEAADLAGVNTRWIVLKVFVLMGMLCGVSAAISTSRLNAGTNSLGTLDELYTIAAAVIGGTSLAGGVGTIAGAILGALVIQSLQSGMVLIGIPSPLQNIVVGIVLVLAVWLDQVYRRRSA